MRWETHAYPNFGKDPQAVINEQIGTDYDIFIGILWSRLGTPTPRFASGTLEEFYTAYEKWKANPSSITLMIYFKDEPVAPSQLDADQLGQIQKFKKELPASGGQYWSFRTVDDFETDVRLHLTRAVQDWRDQLKSASEPTVGTAQTVDLTVQESGEPTGAADGDDVELGFLDYMDLVDEVSKRYSAVLARMTLAMEVIGTRTKDRVAETEALTAQPTVAAARLIFDQSARDLNDLSAALLSDTPQLSQAHADLLKYLVGGAASSLELGVSGREQVLKVLSQLDSFAEAITSAQSQTREYRATLSKLPRMTVTFNRARRRALGVLDALDSAFADFVTRNIQVRTEIADLSDRADATR